MLVDLGFKQTDADFISSKIKVEGARGSGHAWGAVGRWEQSLLRTRIGDEGMDYKGYNIAVHEFGHNVEQTIDLYHIDNFMMAGVPNTGLPRHWLLCSKNAISDYLDTIKKSTIIPLLTFFGDYTKSWEWPLLT